MKEFELIAKYFKPLAREEKSALGLADDAAIIKTGGKKDLVVTTDAIIEGVHFPMGAQPDEIAKRVMRVNLSDIAAMGAKPKYYLLSAMLNASTDEKWLEEFSTSLREEQKEFGVVLVGGDTTKHKRRLAFSLTMIGEIAPGKAIKRSGAKPGDSIFVSGTIGDSMLGLGILKWRIRRTGTDADNFLIRRYRYPEPKVELGQKLVGIANSAIDVSDGLVADLSHICDESEVGARIHLGEIPLSDAAKQVIESDKKYRNRILTGGDDYELLFTVSPKKEKNVETLAEKLGIRITKIGSITDDGNVRIMNRDGREIKLKNKGYSHF